MIDPYIDEKGVLRNKLGIRSQEKLLEAESNYTFKKMLKIDELLKKDEKIDFAYLRKIHKYIFEDIYEFAGEIRTIPITKSEQVLGGDTVRYSFPTEIESHINQIIKKMDSISWVSLTLDERAEKYTKLVAGLWQVHPFREGNTRTTMTFAAHYAEAHNFSLDQQLFKEYSQYTRNALVKASDGMYADYQYLNKIVKDSMQTADEKYFTKELQKAGFRVTDQLKTDMDNLSKKFGKKLTVKEIKEAYQMKHQLDPALKESVIAVVNDFKRQEKQERIYIPEQ